MQEDFEVGEQDRSEGEEVQPHKSYVEKTFESKLRRFQSKKHRKPKDITPPIKPPEEIAEIIVAESYEPVDAEEILEQVEEVIITEAPAEVTEAEELPFSWNQENCQDEEDHDDYEPEEPPKKKMGRPRKYDENNPPPLRSRTKIKVNTESILEDIEEIRKANPTKPQREIHRIFMESKRDWILAKLFDTAENGDTPTIRFNAQARLKDELDGRVATQDKRDPDEDNAIGKILIPEEM